MKLKQYIAELQKILEKEGDLDVMTNYGDYLSAESPHTIHLHKYADRIFNYYLEDESEEGKLVCIV
jgi:hypothetical protein